MTEKHVAKRDFLAVVHFGRFFFAFCATASPFPLCDCTYYQTTPVSCSKRRFLLMIGPSSGVLG